jgi:putative drug exporter of the RND superfamily
MHRFFAATGRFAVRFRWVIVAARVAAVVLASVFFPSLASVARQNNTDLLSASSPSLHAARMATPFQSLNQTPVSVVIARGSGPVAGADITAIGRLSSILAKVTDVQRIKDLGVSADHRAVQLEVLAGIDLANPGPAGHLVAGLRHAVRASALPGDLRAHLAGPVAAQADASQAGQRAVNLGQDLSILFSVALLLVVFRSLLAPLLTLAPAVLVTQLAGPVIAEASKAGLPVSSFTQIMLLILTLGAGTDYGLFLVFRVREELRAGRSPHDAVSHALSRVGESITFSAATVIASLLTLLLAVFGLYSSLGAPLAIAIGFMLLAGLTLTPALLAIFGRAVFWPSNTAQRPQRLGWWGRTAGHIVTHPAATLALGLVMFGALATAVLAYMPAGLGSTPAAPRGSDSATGNALLAAHFPAASSNLTNVLLRFPAPVWSDLARVARAEQRLAGILAFGGLVGPLDVNGVILTPARLAALHGRLGDPGALPALPPPGSAVRTAVWVVYRAESQFISPDGRTVLFDAGLTAGDPGSNAALHRVPAIRAAVAAVARATGVSTYGVAGEAPAGYDVGHASDTDLLHIVPVAIIVIAILLALVLRSIVAPLYLIASVAISYLAAFGVSVLLFQHATGAGGLYYFIPFPDVRVPAGPRRGLQHPGHDPDPGGGGPDAATAGSDPGPGTHRLDGHLRRARPRGHLRSLRPGGGQGARRRRIHQRPSLARDRHPDGCLPGPHPVCPLDCRAARPLELVAIQPRQTCPGHRRTGTGTLRLAMSLRRDQGHAPSRPRTAMPAGPDGRCQRRRRRRYRHPYRFHRPTASRRAGRS